MITHLLVGEFPGRPPVAVAAVEVTRDDNLHWLRGEIHVDPRERRRGYGTLFLAMVEDYARGLDRRHLVLGVMEGPDEVGRAPNRYFAPKMGYRIADEGVRREIDWPRPHGELDALEETWRPFARDYEIVSWVGATPQRWVHDRAHLSAVMPAEAPYADLDVDEEQWDDARVRVHEHTVDQMGRELFVSAALHTPTNTLVAYTELTVSREFVQNAYQWDTLVLTAHRGHRLGGLLKIANMRRLEASALSVERISTFNSTLNEPMIRVNVELGARVSGARVDWRRDL